MDKKSIKKNSVKFKFENTIFFDTWYLIDIDQGGDFKNKQTMKQLFEQEYNCSIIVCHQKQ